jgi:hypothetical protein
MIVRSLCKHLIDAHIISGGSSICVWGGTSFPLCTFILTFAYLNKKSSTVDKPAKRRAQTGQFVTLGGAVWLAPWQLFNLLSIRRDFKKVHANRTLRVLGMCILYFSSWMTLKLVFRVNEFRSHLSSKVALPLRRRTNQTWVRPNRTIRGWVICIFLLFQAYDIELNFKISEFRGHLFLEGSPGVDEQNKKVHPNQTLRVHVTRIPQIVTVIRQTFRWQFTPNVSIDVLRVKIVICFWDVGAHIPWPLGSAAGMMIIQYTHTPDDNTVC